MARHSFEKDNQLDDWDELFEIMLPRLYHYFCYRVGDGRVAEDLTAETFESAWRNRHHYQSDKGLWSNWVFGIARRVTADYFRQHRKDIQLDSISKLLPGPSAEESYEHRADFRLLAHFLSLFPDRECELVALKYGAELTNRSIAQLAGLSESNVGTILNRVVARLRSRWEDEQ